jgi:hypothetical protein
VPLLCKPPPFHSPSSSCRPRGSMRRHPHATAASALVAIEPYSSTRAPSLNPVVCAPIRPDSTRIRPAWARFHRARPDPPLHRPGMCRPLPGGAINHPGWCGPGAAHPGWMLGWATHVLFFIFFFFVFFFSTFSFLVFFNVF